ncbi:hypothetical protein Bca4012_095274 [Brassica carinata]
MGLPKLDYGRIDCSESECERLRCFLVRNLPLHRAQVIESFRLRVGCSCFKPENIQMWVLTAVSHCLRELKIVYESDSAELDILPSNLFTCKSLVILKLAGDIILDVPRMIVCCNGETLQRLLSNCPILEDLMVDLHDYDYTGKLSIVVPSLQSLSLFIPYRREIDGFVIETPSLKYFKLRDDSWHDHYSLIGNMPFLTEAYVDVDFPHISSVIRSITSVKRLAICSQDMLDEGFVFNQLEHLEVCLCTVLFSNQLVRLLNASSKLKRLDMSLTDVSLVMCLEVWTTGTDRVLFLNVCCQVYKASTLNWLEYTGEPQERDIVVYILKHALLLKTATITLTESDFTKLDMIKELARSSRASTTCQLMFD